MIRRLMFSEVIHKVYFNLMFEAFRSRGNATPQDKKVDKAERRSESKILRAIKTISVPIGPEPAEGEVDMRKLTLKPGGGALELEQPEFSRLQGYLERTQWSSGVADVVADLEDWFDAAEKVTEEKAEPLRAVERPA